METETLMLIQKIALLSAYINTTTEHTIFFNFAGHINKLQVQVFYYGWEKDKNATSEDHVYLLHSDARNKLENILEFLSQILMKEVKEVLNLNQFNYLKENAYV